MRRAVLAVGLSLPLLVATGCGTTDDAAEPRWAIKDPHGLRLNVDRLGIAVDDLNSLGDPPHARAIRKARAYGCSVDSGEVFEPQANRSWTLTGPARDATDATSLSAQPLHPTPLAQQAMGQLAADLVARGWSGQPRVTHTKDDVYVIDLHRDYPDHRVHLDMQGFEDRIVAEARTSPGHVCDHRPGPHALAPTTTGPVEG